MRSIAKKKKIGASVPLKMIMEVQKKKINSKFEYAIAELSNLRPKTLRNKKFSKS